jgi:hypothetical protein
MDDVPALVSGIRGDLADSVARLFPGDTCERALAVLAGVEGDRCQVAVLVLGTEEGADVARLEHFAEVAAIDYRDVLYWAEYSPERLDYRAALVRLGISRPYPV